MLVFSTSSQASLELRNEVSCAPLNKEMGVWFQKPNNLSAPIEKKIGPIKNQIAGWCYAFSAADMMSHASNREISGAQIAKNYYEEGFFTWLTNADSGIVKLALERNFEIPLCSERNFSSKTITNIDLIKQNHCSKPEVVFRNFEAESFKASGFNDGSDLFGELDSILLSGRIAGIHYDSSQLTHEKIIDHKRNRADHASTIVARYFDKIDCSCRYIIRNTFGKFCKSILNKKTKCVDGYYSVTETQLNFMLLEVVSLKSKIKTTR